MKEEVYKENCHGVDLFVLRLSNPGRTPGFIAYAKREGEKAERLSVEVKDTLEDAMRQIESEKDTLNRAYRLRQFAKEFNVDKLTVIAEYGEYVHCGVTYRTLLGFGGGIKIYSEPKLSNDQAREIRKELYKGARINEVCSYEDYEEANFSVKEVS